jgi:hypothetical protein
VTGRLPVLTWAPDGSHQVAAMPGGEVLEVISEAELAWMDDAHWLRLLADGEMTAPGWRARHLLPMHGGAYLLQGLSHCSAHRDDGGKHHLGVVLSVITWRANIGRPGHWHGWWTCQDHWQTSAPRQRFVVTGSVTA